MGDEFFHKMPEMLLTADDEVIEVLDAQGLDETLGVGIPVRGQQSDADDLGAVRGKNRIEVLGGINQGDRIAINPGDAVREGAKVQPKLLAQAGGGNGRGGNGRGGKKQ